ncbi:hypothetical protein WA158_001372 [Blastocystis sp. Blastoise]
MDSTISKEETKVVKSDISKERSVSHHRHHSRESRDRRRSHDSRRRHDSRERRERRRSRDSRERRHRSRSGSERRRPYGREYSDYSTSERRYGYDDERRSYRRSHEASPARPAPTEDNSRDRDIRTLFVSDLLSKVDEERLKKYFELAGKVASVSLIRDRNSHRSKGMGYIEMANADDVAKALMLNGQKICTQHDACNCSGYPIKVKRSEAEKNWSVSTTKPLVSAPPTRVTVSNIPIQFNERELQTVFSSYGDIDNVTISVDENGKSKGTGYILFRNHQAARHAVEGLNGTEILNCRLQVSLMSGNTVNSGWRLEDTEDAGGVNMNPQTRAQLMAELAKSKDQSFMEQMQKVNCPGQVTQEEAALGPDGKPIIQGNVSNCLLLKNAFNPMEEREVNWDIDIRDDMLGECSKYGKVLHIYVDKASQGHVYVMFDSIEGAKQSAQDLNGRWFAKRQLIVSYLSSGEYVAKFPETRKAASEVAARIANQI